MKNKLLYLIISMTTCLSIANADYCQPITYDNYWTGNYCETSSCEDECDIYDAYRYVTLGVGPAIIIPNVGIGYRERYAKFGWDAGLSFSTIGYAHQFTGHVVGHYYFNRCRQNSPYIGLGLMGSGVFGNKRDDECGGTLSPDFVFGKELESTDGCRQFIEMHVGIPTLWMESRHHPKGMYFPLMYIKYGFSF